MSLWLDDNVSEGRGSMNELKPCPFCGGTNIDPNGWMDGNGRQGPACDDCGASAESVELWNKRATDTSDPKSEVPE